MGTAIDQEVKAMNDFDTLEVLFKFPSGIMGSIDISRHSTCGYDQRIEVLGTKAVVFAENPKDTTVILANNAGFTTDPSIYSFPTRYKQAYSTEIEHFADLVSGACKVPKLTHHDVRVNCIILHAIAESAQKGVPVNVKYD
jgi:myo-inositol 2-dehydrogenase/D-chiro-inositol 1-dehydrogenase